MSRAELLAYCLGKPGAWVDEPWEGDQVVKVADKIFAFLGGYEGSTIGLKCGRSGHPAKESIRRNLLFASRYESRFRRIDGVRASGSVRSKTVADVEDVALGVGQRCPGRSVLGEIRDMLGAGVDRPLSVGGAVRGDQVDV